MSRRPLIVGVIALAVAAMLTGCVNQPANAVPWLKGQDGIVGASIVSTTQEELLITGVVRGELKPGLSDKQVEDLTARIADYRAHHANVNFQLGRKDIDFWVPEHRNQLPPELAIWHPMTRIAGARQGLVSLAQDGTPSVSLTTLRADAVAVLAATDALAADVDVDAYPDADAIASNTTDDELAYLRPHDCRAPAAVRSFAESLAARSDVIGGKVALCDSAQLTLGAGVSEAATAPTLRADLDARGLSSFPVTIGTPSVQTVPATRVVAVTPGDASLFSVLPTLETQPVSYQLDADGTLTLTEFNTPTAGLLSLVSAAPGAGAVPVIDLQGQTSTVSGPLDQLAGLLQSVDALTGASTALGEVSLSPTTGSAELLSAVGAAPDAAAAAAALRASGLTAGRTWAITFSSTQVDIVNGGPAALHDQNYTSPQVAQSFVDAWNAG